jgi:hypothetical protein
MRRASRTSEDILGQVYCRPGKLGLGAKGGQLSGVLFGEALLHIPPAHCAIETTPGVFAVSESTMGHRQEEQIKSVGRALARRETPLKRRDRLSVPASAELRHTQRVEIDRRQWRQRDRLAGQGQRLIGIARADTARGRLARQIVGPKRGSPRRLGGLLLIRLGLLSMAQPGIDLTT